MKRVQMIIKSKKKSNTLVTDTTRKDAVQLSTHSKPKSESISEPNSESVRTTLARPRPLKKLRKATT